MAFFDVHVNARPETKAFVEKCTRVLDGFQAVNVPGDGYCLLTSIAILTGTDFRPQLTTFVDRYQPSLVGVIDLQNELDQPNNLSEVWASFIADILHCRFMVLTYDGSKTGVVEIVGQTNANFDTTFYLLLKTGHYYPLVGPDEVNISDWLN
tara:strand:- start:148 stop:603 length:456 start_codon:yes stop_codon:yes gene_type:complete